MAETAAESWYYSKGGLQHGPLSHAELQEKISAKELHPAKDLVWKEGMPNWVTLIEVKEQFDLGLAPAAATTQAAPEAPVTAPAKAATKPQPKPEPKAEPAPQPAPQPQQTQKPAPQPQADAQAEELEDFLAESKAPKWPGFGRGPYIVLVFLLTLLWSMWLGWHFGCLFHLFEAEPKYTLEQLNLYSSIGGLLLFVISLVVILKRFTNLEMSRWWYLGQLVPLINLWVGYRCFACPPGYGTQGKMDKTGILLALLYWLLLVGIMVGLVLITFHLLDRFTNDPEFQEEIRKQLELLRQFLEPTSK